MKKTLTAAIATGLGAVVFAANAYAQVRINGFGQVVAGSVAEDNALYPELSYDSDVDFSEESLLAVQVSADLSDRVEVVGQVLARGREDFDVELAWAYAKVRLGKGWSTKIGRQRTGFYRYSDYLDVGFAYSWIRPPVAVYNVPISNYDGISFSNGTFFGDWYSQLQLSYGSYDDDPRWSRITQATKLDNYNGFSWDMTYDNWLSLRTAYYKGKLSIDTVQLNPLLNTLTSVGLGQVATKLNIDDDKAAFGNIGFQADKANWLVTGEKTWRKVKDASIGKGDYWYLTAAYRVGKFTPHVTVGNARNEISTAPLEGLNPANPFYPAVLNVVNLLSSDEDYASAGFRWDVRDNIAIKTEYSIMNTDVPGRNDSKLVSAGVVFTF